jgi:hypothetical protein
MIDPITLYILEEQGIMEGYCLKCAICGKQVEIVKDGQGPLSCCNKRMFVMSGNPESASESKIQPFTEQEEQQFLERVIVERAVLNMAIDEFEKLDMLESKEHLTEEELLELKKTRNILQRAADVIGQTGYYKRKKDLMRLRKKTTPQMRKKMKDSFKSALKKKPGLASVVAKAKKIRGLTKTQGAALRREVGKRLGGDVAGYTKMGRIKDREWVKQRERTAVAKKKIKLQRKERKKQEKAAIKHFRKTGKWVQSPSKPKSKKPQYKSKEDKSFSGNAWMGAEALNLEMELDALIAENQKKVSEVKTGGRLDKAIKRLDRWSKEGILIKKYHPSDKRARQKDSEKKVNEDTLKEYTKNPDGSITFSAADVEKARERSSTYSGGKKHREEEYNKKYGASSIKGFLKMLKGEGFTNDDLKQLISEVLIEAEGMGKLPKGWNQDSLKKFSKSLTGKEGTKKDFFKKCVEKMKGKMDSPEGFCASVKDEMHGSTYWRGKDKSPQEAGKDVKAHQNVDRG